MDATDSVPPLSCVFFTFAQAQLDELKRRVNAVKSKALNRWNVGDLAAWIDVGVGLPMYAKRLGAALKGDAGTGVSPADLLCGMDERALARKVLS
jgi:hypothetical protein